MKSLFRFLPFVLLGLVFVACGKDEDTTAPVITVTSPAEGATLERGKTYPLQGTVTDDTGLASIELGTSLKITTFDTPTKHTFANINLTIGANDPVGNSVISISATDTAGNKATKTVTVKVQ